MMRHSIETLMQKKPLSPNLCEQAMQALFEPETNPLQIAAFLVLLRAKTETAEELIMLVKTLRQKMIVVASAHHVLDIVGTGGDGAKTINISTGSAILAASCGVKIAKHGNRAVSSLSGSADVLEALGVKIELSAEKVSACIDEVGIGFCYSPNFHPAMKTLGELRTQLNVPTTFNLLGPLLNPAKASHYLMGVYDENLLLVMAQVLQQISNTHSLIVHGCGLDEISCAGSATGIEIKAGTLTTLSIDPLQFNLPRCSIDDLRGGNATVNAQLLRKTFAGQAGAVANTLVLNAGVALYLYGVAKTIDEGVLCARDNLLSGQAQLLLNKWIECSHDL